MTPRPDINERASATETTGLLKKAYDSSGSIPLAASYEDVRDSIEQQLQNSTTKQLSDDGPQPSLFRKRNAIAMLIGGGALCALMIVLLSWHPRREHPESHDDNSLPEPVSGYSAPFSHLDPVHDLGLPEVFREKAVSPEWSFLDPSFKSPHDQRNAIPTNAWYQNLIMAKGEPSNLQRVYPAPYLVDVVGMIPGLRAHVTHTESNAEVMQLSFNEDFGLVVGATKSIQSEGSSQDDDDEDGSGDSKPWKSHKYKITSATNLGVSLEWVSVLANF
jgi:hypothetical protein